MASESQSAPEVRVLDAVQDPDPSTLVPMAVLRQARPPMLVSVARVALPSQPLARPDSIRTSGARPRTLPASATASTAILDCATKRFSTDSCP